MDFKKEYNYLLKTIKEKRKAKGLPFRNEDIANELGYTRTHFSNLLGKNGVVTESHIKDLKIHFPDMFEKGTPVESSADISALHKLIDNNKTLVDTAAQLTSMLKSAMARPAPIADEVEDILAGIHATLEVLVIWESKLIVRSLVPLKFNNFNSIKVIFFICLFLLWKIDISVKRAGQY